MVLGYNHNKMIAAAVPATANNHPLDELDQIGEHYVWFNNAMAAAATTTTTTTIITITITIAIAIAIAITTTAAIIVTPIIIIINNYKGKMLHTRRPKIRFLRSTRCTV